MTPTIEPILNQPVSYAAVTHQELKMAFDKFKKFIKKFAETGIISLVADTEQPSKLSFLYIDREYEICFSSGYVKSDFFGKITAYRKAHHQVLEIGAVSFNSRKARILEPLTQTEGSLHETVFCKTILYAWLLQDINWDFAQLSKKKADKVCKNDHPS